MRRVLLVLLVLSTAGCGSGDGDDAADGEQVPTEACLDVFETVVAVQDADALAEELDPAFGACESLADWAAAAERNPAALDGADAEAFARDRCGDAPALADTPVCEDLLP